MLPEYFVVVGALIGFAGGVSYLLATLKGKAKPNRMTWLLWSMFPFIATAAQLQSGVGFSTFAVFASGLLPFLVFCASFINKNAYWRLGRLDYGCGAIAVFGLVMWAVTKDPLMGILFSILADTVASLPTLLKAWQHPETEDGPTYILCLVGNVIALLAVQSAAFEAIGFQAYLSVLCLAMVLAIYRRRFLSGQP